MNNKKEIFEKIADVKEEVLLGDVVRVLRALNEDIDDVIEVSSNYQMRKVEYPKKSSNYQMRKVEYHKKLQLSDNESRISQKGHLDPG